MPLHTYMVGDRVRYKGHVGTVRFVGMTLWSVDEREWCGIAFDQAVGKHDGMVSDVRYFQSAPGTGMFVRRLRLQPVGSLLGQPNSPLPAADSASCPRAEA